MRPTLLALLASAAIVAATGCAQNNLDELAARISCGTNKAISKCLHGDIDLARLEEIEDCLVSGGCSMADATVEAVWFTFDCRAGQEELKRRQDEETTSTEESTTEEETTTKETTSKTTTAKTTSTTAPSSTEATTTSESSTESTTSTTSSTEITASSTTSTSSQTSSQTSTASAQSATTTGPLVCSVTSTKSTSMCFVSAGKTQSCVATTTEIASCAPGLICFSATAGANSCMRRDNSLTTSGLVVAIAFGVGLAATAIAVIAMVIRGKNKVKANQQAQLLAAASSRGRGGRDVEAGKAFTRPMASDANLPLITPGGQRSDHPGYGQQDYFEGAQRAGSLTPPEYRGAGSSGSGAPPVPRLELHQGLGALGQNPRY